MPIQDMEKKIEAILEVYGNRVDPQGMSDGFDEALKDISSLIKEEREKVIEELKAEFEETIKGYNYYCECEDSCGCAYEVLGGIEDNFIDKLVKASKL